MGGESTLVNRASEVLTPTWEVWSVCIVEQEVDLTAREEECSGLVTRDELTASARDDDFIASLYGSAITLIVTALPFWGNLAPTVFFGSTVRYFSSSPWVPTWPPCFSGGLPTFRVPATELMLPVERLPFLEL